MNLKLCALGLGIFGLLSGPVLAKDVLTEKEAEAEVEAFYKNPERMLRYSYHNYMVVAACYEAREGLAVQYINQADLQKAKNLGGEIQAILLKKDDNLDGDAVWKKAFEGFGDFTLTPLVYVARMGGLNDIYFNLVQSAFRGNTSAERKVYFENGVRGNGENWQQFKGICQTALENLSSDLVKISGDGEVKSPEKDF